MELRFEASYRWFPLRPPFTSTHLDVEHPHHPAPLCDGNLRVDPEIRLPSPGMDVDIAYFYNSNVSDTNALADSANPYGFGRTASVNLLAQASGLSSPIEHAQT